MTTGHTELGSPDREPEPTAEHEKTGATVP